MGILDSLFTKRFSLTDEEALRELFPNLFIRSGGTHVTVDGSLKYAAVYAAVRVLSETIASLPLNVMERQPNRAKRRATDFYLYDLLHKQPNPRMTSFQLRETLQSHLLLWGNAYCDLDITARGRIRAIWPLRPDKVEKIEPDADVGLIYYYRLPNQELRQLPAYRVLHIRGLSSNGVVGYSPISLARQAIGLGLDAEAFGARFFSNDTRPGGVLKHPGILDDKAYDRMRKSWDAAHAGLDNAHRVAILEEGTDFQAIGVPPEAAQFLETRKFQTAEVARIFRVPPHMIGDLDRATFSNVEQQSIDFVVHSVRPWLVRWEQSLDQQLMSKREQAKYYTKFIVDGLLRGDTQSRYQAYAVARQNGWMSANDIRELEDMNPIEGGNVYLVPLNMVPATQAGNFGGGHDGEEPRALPAGARMHKLHNGVEIRAHQADAARQRHRLQTSYIPLFRDVEGRIIRREANDISNAARRLLQKRTQAEFDAWLDKFYRDHMEFVEQQLRPLLDTYSRQVIEAAAAEVGNDVPVLSGFFSAYLGSAAVRHVAKQEDRLRTIMSDNPESLLASIEAELERWREVKPDQFALDESVRSNNAFALAAYGALAVTRKVWVTIGDNCPYCDSLGGRTVGIETFFLPAGQEFQPDGADVPLQVSRNVGHAPAHRGCDCMVVAG